jgi:AraC family transcriptional regulator
MIIHRIPAPIFGAQAFAYQLRVNLLDVAWHLTPGMQQTALKASALSRGCPWPSEVVVTSAASNWNDIVFETHSAMPEQCSSEPMEMHVISLILNTHSEFTRKDALGRSAPYLKTPEVLTLTPVGFTTDFSLRTPARFVHVGLDKRLIEKVLLEGEKAPGAADDQRIGIRDRSIFQIVDLLRRELDAESPSGRLYVDSLANALAARYLAAREATTASLSRVRPLPKRLLDRIKEKMNAHLGSDLSLNDLALEAGYSNGHFLRMFRASTGSTPHHFYLSLRLERAKDRLAREETTRIVDIASECGFSTQSYFTDMFRRRFGVTPSSFRRQSHLR